MICLHRSFFARAVCFIFIAVSALLLAGCSRSGEIEPVQLKEGSGIKVARFNVKDYGCFDLRIFSHGNGDSVSSFLVNAENGYYNGKTIKNVIEDYGLIISAENEGASGVSDASFENELDKSFYPLFGSLVLTDSSKGTSADSFMIITADSEFLSDLKELLAYKKITPAEYYKTAYGTDLTEEQLAVFDKYGGAPWLYGHCIVLGQVYSGQDVISALSKVPVEEGSTYIPEEELIIESVEVR